MNIEAYLKRDYIRNIMSDGKRIDGRGFDERRNLEIEKGYVLEKADGSALVKLGGTQVLVGISMDVGEPYSDRPTSGVMTTSAELRPLASPYFESGPPREESIELARVVDRGIRESGMIDVDKLFIEEGKVWMVFIDLHMLDDCGNLLDASGIAAAAALHDCRLPKYEDGQVIRGDWKGKLPITCTPIPNTFAKIRDTIVLDPLSDEEYAMDARLTVTTTDTVNAMQKGGEGKFTIDEIEGIVDKAFENSGKIRDLVEK
ncbi:MAG: exosome complex protein Rrp42 [Candidatus Altiarchaeota archaeon]